MNETITNFQTKVVEITPTLDTSAYISGDVLFIANLVSLVGALPAGQSIRAEVVDITIVDKSANAGLFDLVFFKSAPTTLGAVNAAVNLSSADVALVRRAIPVTSYTAMKAATNGLAQPEFQSFTIEVPADALGFFVAGISRDTKTYAASDLQITIGTRLHNVRLS
jgi:hypothetical protein